MASPDDLLLEETAASAISSNVGKNMTDFSLKQANGVERVADTQEGESNDLTILSRAVVETSIRLKEQLKLLGDNEEFLKLQLWFSHLNTKPVDLISVLGGHSLVVVHGDSLLLYIFALLKTASEKSRNRTEVHSMDGFSAYSTTGSEPTPLQSTTYSSIDSTTSFDMIEDMQCLQIIFAFERQLHRITECGGYFKVVFFDIYHPLFQSLGESYWLCRQLLLLHLQLKRPEAIFVFHDWYSSGWQHFLQESYPSCILMEDGTTLLNSVHRSRLFLSEEMDEEFIEETSAEETGNSISTEEIVDRTLDSKNAFPSDEEYTAMLLPMAFLSNCLINQLNTALLYRMHRKGKKMMVMAMGSEFGLKEIEIVSKALVFKWMQDRNLLERSLSPLIALEDSLVSLPKEMPSKLETSLPQESPENFISTEESLATVMSVIAVEAFYTPEGSLIYKDFVEAPSGQAKAESDSLDHVTSPPSTVPFFEILRILSSNFKAVASTEAPLSFPEMMIALFCLNLSGDLPTDEDSTLRYQGCLTAGKLLLLSTLLKKELHLPQRCHRSPSFTEWDFLTQFLRAILSFYFCFSSEILSQLLQRLHPTVDQERDNLQNFIQSKDLVDFFDGRFFGTLCHASVCMAKDNKGRLTADMWGATAACVERLTFIWRDIAKQSDSFFPIDLSIIDCFLDEENLPPLGCLPTQEASPLQVKPFQSKFYDFLSSTLLSAKKKLSASSLCQSAQQRTDDATLEALPLKEVEMDVAYEEFKQFAEKDFSMDFMTGRNKRRLNLAKTAEEKRRIQKQNTLQSKQKNISNLHVYAKSLAGADNLHFPIIVREDHTWNKLKAETRSITSSANKEKSVKLKISQSKEKLIEKAQEEARKKKILADTELLKDYFKKADELLRTEPETFSSVLLNLTVGYTRSVDIFAGFPSICSLVETPEARVKCLMKIASNSMQILKTFTEEKGNQIKSRKRHLCRCVCFTFRFVFDVFNDFLPFLSGSHVVILQRILLSLGFKKSSFILFSQWKTFVEKQRTSKKISSQKDTPRHLEKGKSPSKKEEKILKASNKKSSTEKKLTSIPLENIEEDLEKYFVKDSKEAFAIAIPSNKDVEFQLEYMAAYMDRCTGGKFDERVKFKPDAWQKKLLDIIDKYESAIVHAPTSSGKTFICYYVMDKVLQYDNDSVVVYVSPSKALMLQVRADIYARFANKNFPTSCITKLDEAAERLRRSQNCFNCQLLVTVPYVLETILLSSEYTEWVKRIKYVILDEMHCIGEEEEARSWEHLFQLIPSPLLAMSATIGNPNALFHWIKLCQQRDKKVHYICHKERFSDLSKYWYTGERIISLHPLACLSFRTILEHGISSDFTISPLECVTLYYLLVKLLPNYDLSWLNPSFYFEGCGALTKTQCSLYSRTLLHEFQSLIRVSKWIDPEKFSTLSKELLNGSWDSGFTSISDTVRKEKLSTETTDILPQEATTEKDYLDADKFLQTIRTLQSKELLPALFFNFSRLEIHVMMNNAVTKLQKDQWNKYYGTEEATYITKGENKKRMAAYKMKLQRKAMEAKMKQVSREQREMQDLQEGEENDEDLIAPKDIAETYDEEFNFANW